MDEFRIVFDMSRHVFNDLMVLSHHPTKLNSTYVMIMAAWDIRKVLNAMAKTCLQMVKEFL